MKKLDIFITEEDLCNIPKDGPLIICANHPNLRTDRRNLKMAVSKVRGDVHHMHSLGSITAAKAHLKKGGALILLPIVSSSRMRLIAKSGVPVVPAFVTEKTPDNPVVTIKFGKVARPAELRRYKSAESLGRYLKNRIYALEGEIERASNPVPPTPKCPIDPHVDAALLRKELEGNSSHVLFKDGGYTCYLNRISEIPNIIHEIGVCREETFRHNGEGTGKSCDLDIYDEYYLHMHLWHDETGDFVGAYRVGMGSEIMRERGVRGFYSDLFFHFSEGLGPVLAQSIELGRSFVVDKYQVVPNALKMLLNNGIGHLVGVSPSVKYFIGPASISSDIPLLYSSIMVEYFKRTRMRSDLCSLVTPDVAFVPNFLRVDLENLHLERLDIDQFDKLLLRLSSGKFRVPPLVRAYVKYDGKFIGFNVDPGFNYCVDALVLVDIDAIREGVSK